MDLNEEQAGKFLAVNGIENSTIKKVAGDASFRSYYRIFSGEKLYILMFAPPSHEDVKPFIKIDDWLVSQGFFAPKILARDIEAGFLLLEDFGDDTFTRVLVKDSSAEEQLYKNACDVLLDLHKIAAPSDLPKYDYSLLLREVFLFTDWYLPLKKKTNDSCSEG